MKETEQTLLDHIKDEVAISHGYVHWNEIEDDHLEDVENKLWPIVCERYATAKDQAIALKIDAMQKEIEDNHDGDPWNNGAITTLEEVKKLFDQPIEEMFTRSQVQASCEATLIKAAENAYVDNNHIQGQCFDSMHCPVRKPVESSEPQEKPRRQEFEKYPVLTEHISRMYHTGTIGSLIEWSNFLQELNRVLKVSAPSESQEEMYNEVRQEYLKHRGRIWTKEEVMLKWIKPE